MVKKVPVNVKMIRTKEELNVFLKSVLQSYDGALAVYTDKEKAKLSVIRSYDDLQEWLYEGLE